jgi:hypothetical protein
MCQRSLDEREKQEKSPRERQGCPATPEMRHHVADRPAELVHYQLLETRDDERQVEHGEEQAGARERDSASLGAGARQSGGREGVGWRGRHLGLAPLLSGARFCHETARARIGQNSRTD